jgi:pSer/pThr/pTyr-binding forkhead associated (FHA) protein
VAYQGGRRAAAGRPARPGGRFVPKLIVTDADRTWLIDLRPGESLTIGRALDCDLPIASPRASRRHAEVVARGDGHAVRDLGSTNGTSLNGAPLEGERLLGDLDLLEVGGCRLVYRSRP